MPGFGEILQKAVYLGVGLASYATEKASKTLAELRTEAQKLADELVKRGEMSSEEARRFVDDLVQQAQRPPGEVPPASNPPTPSEPRRIEILDDDESATADAHVGQLRKQVQDLQDQLRRLQQD